MASVKKSTLRDGLIPLFTQLNSRETLPLDRSEWIRQAQPMLNYH
jgi:hypothetical protein